MNKSILTVTDLMTILCDCVDSGTLDMDSAILLYVEQLDYLDNKNTIQAPAYDHNIIHHMGKKALRLTSVI